MASLIIHRVAGFARTPNRSPRDTRRRHKYSRFARLSARVFFPLLFFSVFLDSRLYPRLCVHVCVREFALICFHDNRETVSAPRRTVRAGDRSFFFSFLSAK